jgi:hypothetical protein
VPADCAEVTAIARYPVKSCRGEPLRSAMVERWGLAGDRRWMAVDADGEAITAREHPRLLLVRPELVDDGLRLTSPDADELSVETPPLGRLVEVDVWGARVLASAAGAVADAWFSKILGVPARLVYLDDPTRRPTNPLRTLATDRVSFADGYPLHLITEESVAAVNELVARGKHPHEGPLPAVRFRPSVVVRGWPAWAEDGWRRVRIGPARFRVVKGCDRCVLTTIHPETAARGREPLATLVRHRRWDGQSWFGVMLVPDTDGVPITVGDPVEILESVDPADGPLR